MRQPNHKQTILECRTKILVALLFALMLGATACGDDSPDGDSVDAGGGGGWLDQSAGQINATPNPLAFETVLVGEESTLNVTISNTGESPLHITEITLIEEPVDLHEEFFRQGDGWSAQELLLDPGASHQVSVGYQPADEVLDAGSIVINSDDPNHPRYSIPITTEHLEPRLDSPASVSFLEVTPPSDPFVGDAWRGVSKLTPVRNTGEAPLRIDDIRIRDTNGAPFSFSIAHPTDAEIAAGDAPDPQNDTMAWPEYLAPGEQFDVRVWFAPTSEEPQQSELIFETNDPTKPEFSVDLNGNAGLPCIEVRPVEAVIFESTTIGRVNHKTVSVTNCSEALELKLSEIAIADDGNGVFEIVESTLPDSGAGGDMILDAGGVAYISVTFTPTHNTSVVGSMTINSNDPSQPVTDLQLTGHGSQSACPTAVATASIVENSDIQPSTTIEARPYDSIQLDASASSDPDGHVARYRWTLLSSPHASTARIEPAHEETPTLDVAIVGEYKIGLTVFDNNGTVNCGEPAVVTVDVQSVQDIYIQLTWKNPSVEEEHLDADLDLHYLHPSAPGWMYNSEGYDCYYANKTPNWGGTNKSPVMTTDDLHGPGPETIGHSNLDNIIYKVGVEYYSDNGNGSSLATVEIRRHGVLVFTAADRELTHKQFWLVAVINGRTLSVESVDTITPGYPEGN